MNWSDIYNNQFQKFKERESTKIFGDFGDWRKGRSIYYGFVIKVKDDKIVKKIVEVQKKLKQFSFITFHPPNFFHISLKALGFWDMSKKYNDSLDQGDVDNWTTKAENVASQLNKFKVSIKGLNSWANSLFCELHDESGNLMRLIMDLEGENFSGETPRVPHLTIGYYTKEEKNGVLVEKLTSFRNFDFGKLKVAGFQLIKQESVGQNLYQSLEIIKEFQLGNNC